MSTRTRPFQNSFSSGEISPRLHARSDFQRYQTGLAKARGFIPQREGGLTRAPGTIHRGNTHLDLPCRRVPFEFAENDALVLEFTNLTMRVWRYGELVLSGGSPYTLTTPYPTSSLWRLQWVQDKDVVYLADGVNPVQKLSRFALDNWTIEDAAFINGPFLPRNVDDAVTIQASDVSGTVTLTGVGNPFSADMVGSLFLLEPTDNDITIWQSDIDNWGVGHRVTSDNKIYLHLGPNNWTGLSAPVHEFGDVTTSAGVSYRFESDLKGVVLITAVTNANLATAQVQRRLPEVLKNNPTYRWSEGAWSARNGYPACLEMYEQRLWLARTPNEPRTAWASAIGDFHDHLPSTEDDGPFAYTIAAAKTQNAIEWLFRGRHGIFIGALGEVLIGFSDSADLPIGPVTFDTEIVSADGAAAAEPIAPYGYPIYITKGLSRLQELRASLNEPRGEPVELSLPSAHLGDAGFHQVAWQSNPQKIAWLRDGNGDLVAMVYDPAQDVLGWSVIPVADGVVQGIDVTPAADGSRDIVTIVVVRVIDGNLEHHVEEIAPDFALEPEGQDPVEAVHLFDALSFSAPGGQVVFSVPHLVGETVYAWTDAGHIGPLTVSAGGTVTLPVSVTKAVIGLHDATHYADTLDLEAQARDGASRGRLRKLEGSTGIDLYRTAGGTVAVIERDFDKGDTVSDPEELVPDFAGSDRVTAKSATRSLDLTSGNADAIRLRFTPAGGAPMTVLSVIPQMQEAGP